MNNRATATIPMTNMYIVSVRFDQQQPAQGIDRQHCTNHHHHYLLFRYVGDSMNISHEIRDVIDRAHDRNATTTTTIGGPPTLVHGSVYQLPKMTTSPPAPQRIRPSIMNHTSNGAPNSAVYSEIVRGQRDDQNAT